MALKRATRNNPEFERAMEWAREELHRQGESEMFSQSRAQLRSDDPKLASAASDRIAKFLNCKRNNATRKEVTALQCETKVTVAKVNADSKETVAKINAESAEKVAAIKAQGRGARRKAQDGPKLDRDGHPVPEMTPEMEERQRQVQRRHDEQYAEQVARGDALVYLWGGCHKMGDAPPDATDTPLMLISDATLPTGRIFWAVTNPPPTADPYTGPFLAPPGCRPTTYPSTAYPPEPEEE